ncbi:MAG: AAA domain-containing protein [Actinobacteria bacterium]|nr:AAA domain-containing protein [Actinomycetota bacterium]
MGVLELVSENKNAFDDLLIDQAFFETWVSQITMAMKYTSEDKKSGAVKTKRLHLPYIQKNNVIPLLPVEKIEREFGLVGSGESIFQLRDYIRKTSNMSSGPILLSGESGSGKELVARAIHKVGERANNSFIACDCGTFGELVDDRMFGHLKGAYTGATEASNGLFEEADNGILFLDEISNLSLSVQPNFLRVLEDYSFAKIGSSKTTCVNVFVIAATNQNLKAMVDRGDFRADLYYRLEAISINTVPLRRLVLEDKNNLLQLVSYFVHIDQNNINGIQGISTSSYKALLSYNFEGNVRELRNMIKKAIFYLDKDGVLNFLINSDKQDSDDSNKIIALLRRLSKKYLRKDIPAFVERAALNVILSLLNEPLTPEEGISRFIEKIGPIDIPIAMLFTQRGETWTRKILKEDFHLTLDKDVNLYS